MNIELTIESNSDCKLTKDDLRFLSENIFKKLSIKNLQTTIEVFLVDNTKIQTLNHQYLGKDKVTDVLSFPQKIFPKQKEKVLGTIFIAPEFAKSENLNCQELFIHGLLHLLGFDHEKNKNEWNDIEKQIKMENHEL
jgi:probable rRNA maturation factor